MKGNPKTEASKRALYLLRREVAEKKAQELLEVDMSNAWTKFCADHEFPAYRVSSPEYAEIEKELARMIMFEVGESEGLCQPRRWFEALCARLAPVLR